MSDPLPVSSAAPPLPGNSEPSFPPLRGVTVGTVNEPAVSGQDHASIERTVSGQGIAGAVFAAALLPPVIVCLLYGIQHQAHLIPYSPVWAWGSLVLALVLAVRIGTAAGRRGGANGIGSLAAVVVLLIVPAVVLVYFTFTEQALNPRFGVAQIVLYAIAAVALLLGWLSASAAE